MEQVHPVPQDNSKLIRRLLLLVALAFVFAFALVPLYNVLSEATGFNGKTSGKGIVRDGFAVGGLKPDAVPAPAVDLSRTVRVEFTGTHRAELKAADSDKQFMDDSGFLTECPHGGG